jgi:DNA polymerase III subunit epsilon
MGWLSRLFGRAGQAVPERAEPHIDLGRAESRSTIQHIVPATTVATPREDASTAFVIDVETTGLLPYDRIVALAAVRLIGLDAPTDGHYYLVFDPRKDNHPEAAALHGWDDWTLRFQDLFAAGAAELHRALSAATLLICHNAEFDMAMLQREFRKAGLPPLATPVSCTMMTARERWPGERATLDACLARIGQARAGRRHGAFEDAFLTMNLYRFYHGAAQPYRVPADPKPTNYRMPPPRPAGKLPRRTAKTWNSTTPGN